MWGGLKTKALPTKHSQKRVIIDLGRKQNKFCTPTTQNKFGTKSSPTQNKFGTKSRLTQNKFGTKSRLTQNKFRTKINRAFKI
jgi:hypothetical protein